MLLLAVLLFGATAAAPTAEQAARDARSALDRSNLDEARRILEDALRRFGASNDETIWLLRAMRGEELHARGEYLDAQKALEQEPPAALRHREPAVRRLWTLGNSAINLGDSKEAARLLEQAHAIAVVHQPQMLPEIYTALAINAPDVIRAGKFSDRAVAAARRYGKPGFEARARAAMQYQLGREGRYSDAILVGETALETAQSLKMASLAMKTAGNLGWSYTEIGDYETAAELFALADRTAAQMRAETERVPWLTQLGNLHVQKHDWTAAERSYLDALTRARSARHPQLGFILANLAVVSIETGRLANARRYNAEALALKKDRDSVRRSWIIDARIANAAGDSKSAIAILQRVVNDPESKKATQWEASGRLAEAFAKSNRVDEAVAQFRESINTVREARAAINNRELRLSFFNITADIFSAYIDFLIGQRRIAGALAATEVIRVDALNDALNEKTTLPAIDACAIAKQQNATILSYWLGPHQSYVWKITPNDIRVAKLQSDSKITAKVEAYRKSVTSARGTLALSGAQGQQLYELLGKPRGSRVIVIPDGSLYSLNFETLVVPSPRPHYWIEDALISVASSIRALARQPRAKNRPADLLLVGNPPSAGPEFPPLPKAADEMRSIEKHFRARAKVLEGAAATPAAYQNASPRKFGYVHFVAHGTASRTRPLESAVILAGGKLLARDVVKQPLGARLVTISSCHGAGTRAYAGEGLVGLAWAFLHAGASSVIAALWEVNDSATPQLMDRFYAKTAAGADPAAALREAKLSLLTARGVRSYARYWAPFVYYE
ncbi:MAG TPA: CHAT domain-containing protein [Thermoanaerobaculia bacterium]|nr:CHAT domain-containing protein [Thermoanaerobaculia bacterium]